MVSAQTDFHGALTLSFFHRLTSILSYDIRWTESQLIKTKQKRESFLLSKKRKLSPLRFGLVLLLLLSGAVLIVIYLLLREAPGDSDTTLKRLTRPESKAGPVLGGFELPEAVDAAAGYLNRHIDENGRFVYRINLDGFPQKERYNILRHAGSICVLSMYYKYSPDRTTKQTIIKAAKYLKDRYLHSPLGQERMLAVFSLPNEEIMTGGRQAKLGGCALGLIALIEARKLNQTVATLKELTALGRFILFMQMEDGRFHSKFDEERAFADDFESLYYPGETILALTRLYQENRDPIWLEAALKGVAYLVRSRMGADRLPNDHWLMIAARELLPLLGNLEKPVISEKEIRDHVWALGRSMLIEQASVSMIDGMEGCFVPDGRSAPTATRLEGLIALHSMIAEADGMLKSYLRISIADGIAFLLRCQVSTGPARGGFVRAIRKLSEANQSFFRRQSEIRIDYVQHALSALIGYSKMLSEEEQSPR